MAIYQVNFSVENVGKRQEDSKKRVRWVFQVVEGGGQGHQQHEIEFTWSLRSGKQEVTMDGQNVMFTKKKGRSVFDETLTKLGEKAHLQLVCARKAPLKAHPDFRCYELLIDDKPFGTYPKLNNGGPTPPVEEQDIMNAPCPFYDGPMSILDILFPGKYSEAPAKQLEIEDDMAFPENEYAVTVSDQQTNPYAIMDPPTTTSPQEVPCDLLS